MWRWALMWWFAGLVLLRPVWADDPGRVAEVGQPIDRHYCELARQFQRAGQSFDTIFSALCREVLTNATPAGQSLAFSDRVRAMFGGLWIWTHRGGAPVLQGRHDWALHFIGGGAFQGYWDAGRATAIIKERKDSRGAGQRYDLDDLAATMLGARWMDLAVNGRDAQSQAWVRLWAERHMTLGQSLPALRYGQLPAGEAATAEVIQDVWRATEEQLQAFTPADPTP